MKATEIEVEREAAGCGVPRARVHVALAIFYVVATLLSGEALLREAELMKYGRTRDVCVALARPVAAVTRALHMGRPRAALERWFNAGDAGSPSP